MRSRGFTLLEVMVAVTILGLGLTMILSSQAGLLGTTYRIRNQAHADTLLRCKVGELEVELLKNGYSLTDVEDSGECCADAEADSFACSWKVEKVELPQPTAFAEANGADSDADKKGAEKTDGDKSKSAAKDDGSMDTPPAAPSAALPSELGAFAKFQSIGAPGGVGLPAGGKPEDLMGALGGGGGTQGMISMMMGLVYPMLKPMLEASIRRISVTISWPEGGSEKSMTVVEFVTNPTQGGLLTDAAAGALSGAVPGIPGATGTGATGAPSGNVASSPGAGK